ncbi:MAG: hypothetical protein NZ108_05585, partial [Bacteroidia bacterium]|nr:hypothetical protein [Bacteroidia bacterium]
MMFRFFLLFVFSGLFYLSYSQTEEVYQLQIVDSFWVKSGKFLPFSLVQNRLWVYNYLTGEFRYSDRTIDQPNLRFQKLKFGNQETLCKQFIGDGKLWIATPEGRVYQINKRMEKGKRVSFERKNARFQMNLTCYNHFVDFEGRLYFTSEAAYDPYRPQFNPKSLWALSIYDYTDRNLRHIPLPDSVYHKPGWRYGFYTQPNLMLDSQRKRVYLSTDTGRELYCYDIIGDSFVVILSNRPEASYPLIVGDSIEQNKRPKVDFDLIDKENDINWQLFQDGKRLYRVVQVARKNSPKPKNVLEVFDL